MIAVVNPEEGPGQAITRGIFTGWAYLVAAIAGIGLVLGVMVLVMARGIAASGPHTWLDDLFSEIAWLVIGVSAFMFVTFILIGRWQRRQ